MVCASDVSICPTAIQRPARSSTTNCDGWNASRNTRKNYSPKRSRSFSPGTTTLSRTEIDVYKPEHWVKDALFLPEVRSAFANLVAMGWTDALRKLHPDERIYTFWDYFRN